MRRQLMRTRAPIFSSRRRIVPQVASRTGCDGGRSGAVRTAEHRPARRTTAAADWPSSSLPTCGRRTGRLAFLDAVLHLSPGAVDVLVEPAGIAGGRAQRGDDEARVAPAMRPFCFGDDQAPAAPAVVRRPPERLETPRWPTRRECRGLDRRQLAGELGLEPGIAGETEDEIDTVRLAPAHKTVPGEAAVGAQEDLHSWPTRPNLPDDARDLLDGTGRRVDVGPPELRREQVPPAEHIEWQVTVAIVVAVKEPALLAAVDRIVGRIEIEGDLCRRFAVSIEEQVDKQPFNGWEV